MAYVVILRVALVSAQRQTADGDVRALLSSSQLPFVDPSCLCVQVQALACSIQVDSAHVTAWNQRLK